MKKQLSIQRNPTLQNATENTRFTAAILALKRRNPTQFNNCLTSGLNPNYRDRTNQLLIEYVIKADQFDFFSLLLDFGANPEELCSSGYTLFQHLHEKLPKGHHTLAMMHLLIERGVPGIAYEIEGEEEIDPHFSDVQLYPLRGKIETALAHLPSVWQRPSLCTDAEAEALLSELRTQRLQFLKEMIIHPKMAYPKDEDGIRLGFQSLEQALHAFEISLKKLDLEYGSNGIFSESPHEKGANHAQRFKQIFEQDFLFMDCSLALILADFRAFLQVFGETAFNKFIDKRKSFAIESQISESPIGYASIELHSGVSETEIAAIVNTGDIVYFTGIPTYNCFHREGTLIGVNTLAEKDPVTGNLLFIAFHNRTPSFTYDELIAELTQDFNQNVTYRDLLAIRDFILIKEDKKLPLTYQEVMDLLIATNGQDPVTHELEEAQRRKTQKLPLDERTSLQIPQDMRGAPVGITLILRAFDCHGISNDDESSMDESTSTYNNDSEEDDLDTELPPAKRDTFDYMGTLP